MLYLGLVAGVFAGAYVAQSTGVNPDRFGAAILILVIPALVGARLLFVLTHWDIYARDIPRIWRRSEGGMAMYGGLIMAVPLSIPLLAAMGLPFGKFWDAATFTMLLGMIFTRVGCLLNGCCSGRPSDAWYSLSLPDHRGIWRRRIPTQLLEMFWATILFVTAVMAHHRGLVPGVIFTGAVVTYTTGRYFLQKLREDTGGDAAALQITSVLLGIAALIGLILATIGVAPVQN